MQTPLDLKSFRADDYAPLGAFQITPPSVAAWALVYGVILGLIFAPVMK